MKLECWSKKRFTGKCKECDKVQACRMKEAREGRIDLKLDLLSKLEGREIPPRNQEFTHWRCECGWNGKLDEMKSRKDDSYICPNCLGFGNIVGTCE